ncbi:histone demethylase (H3-trimethyl-K4 specific), Lid2 complex subunit Lid2 [Schizosaccharomyces pombe]|uniref:Lid2 complex component lid2 n=1 Tax=Schizosaccharomyces pombe (strain 972 / ATCC 24843) TaxID=284812 RepID=LID2_SCHPO|nr:Lid2 complex putative histone demethylase subunit Lid2 [Schizosaccharomyces pombe]Q9HDV4.1 RecName: Full=Lid2 complex component lid2; Short=Lid2C component lid2 [Schizosaccharomyces pombe 972h-]CAC19756.1 Lid2 complex subunit, predicted histone demethylase Lid2 [Schizosaccharomyces pombe]|eukprot:NP_596174.1 Lid2 complex putative histone demethylase subunit Lid2 [Schizosaccharomyces pombe]
MICQLLWHEHNSMGSGREKKIRKLGDNFSLPYLKFDCDHNDKNYRASNRPFGLSTGLSVQLNASNMTDPFKFLLDNWHTIFKNGAIKLLPPEGWQIPVVLDQGAFEFQSKRQCLNKGCLNYEKNYDYFKKLKAFHESRGLYFYHPPIIGNRPVDFLRLRNAISKFTNSGSSLNNEILHKVIIYLRLEDTKEVRQVLTRCYDRYIKPFERDSSPSFKSKRSESSTRKIRNTRSSAQQESPIPETSAQSPVQTIQVNGSTSLKRPLIERGEQCEYCGLDKNPETILLCDGCEAAYHTSCLDPPLTSIPKEDWYCDACKFNISDYDPRKGFKWKLSSLKERSAEIFNTLGERNSSSKLTNLTEDDIELFYWSSLAESNSGFAPLELEGLSQAYTSTIQSSLPSKEVFPLEKYSSEPWNLHNLPFENPCLFNYSFSDLSSLTITRLSIGMVFYTHGWTKSSLSTGLLHHHRFGDTVTWYVLPPDESDAFERYLISSYPQYTMEDLNRSNGLPVIVSPSSLIENGFHPIAIDLRPNEFLVVSPNSYHMGFHQGFSSFESVNFATVNWIKDGLLNSSISVLKSMRIPSSVSYEAVIISMVLSKNPCFSSEWLIKCFEDMIANESASKNEIMKLVPNIQALKLESSVPLEIRCSNCKQPCFLSFMQCHEPKKFICLGDCVKEVSLNATSWMLFYRWDVHELSNLAERFVSLIRGPEEWTNRLRSVLSTSPKPQLKVLKSLLVDAEKAMLTTPETVNLRDFVQNANSWIDSVNECLKVASLKRKKDKKPPLFKAHDHWNNTSNLKDSAVLFKVLQTSRSMAFTCQEIENMKQKAFDLLEFRNRLINSFSGPLDKNTCQRLLTEAELLGFTIPELGIIQKYLIQFEWLDMFYSFETTRTTDSDLERLITYGVSAGIPEDNDYMIFAKAMKGRAEIWENQVYDTLSKSNISYDKLSLLRDEAMNLCVNKELFSKVVGILNNAEEIKNKIATLCERSQEKDFALRPSIDEVKEALASAEKLPILSESTVTLQKMYDVVLEWIRRGKRLFGKANAPLEILGQHLDYVEKRNSASLSLNDRPGPPMEPASRETSPDSEGRLTIRKKKGCIFCFCRLPESGVMIECEICHEWYHAKCLKMSKKKLRQDEKFTCPICDYRVEIPRLSNRPKLEDLQSLYKDVKLLPFQPKETETLRKVVDLASKFRQEMQALAHNPFGLTMAEVPLARFYLRKMEGAEILLVDETNLFRQKLHECVPIAPNPPPIIGESKSTRKPRPTKRQRQIMKQVAEGLLPASAIAPPKSSNEKKSSNNVKAVEAETKSKSEKSPKKNGTNISDANNKNESHVSLMKNWKLGSPAFVTLVKEKNSSCLCGEEFSPRDSFIDCTICERRFHYDCVGLNNEIADSVSKFTCPICMEQSGGIYPWQLRPRNGMHPDHISGFSKEVETDPKLGSSGYTLNNSKFDKAAVSKTLSAQDVSRLQKVSCGEHLYFGTDVFTPLGDMATSASMFSLDDSSEKTDAFTENFLNV